MTVKSGFGALLAQHLTNIYNGGQTERAKEPTTKKPVAKEAPAPTAQHTERKEVGRAAHPTPGLTAAPMPDVTQVVNKPIDMKSKLDERFRHGR